MCILCCDWARMQGVFRGFQDTKTPFYVTLASNAVNIVLGALFIFGFHWGVRGAALGTVLAQVRGQKA
jgi:MATE family multidrug resistance protein